MEFLYLLLTFGIVYLIFSAVEIKKNLRKVLGEKYNADDESIVSIVEKVLSGDIDEAKKIYFNKYNVSLSEADSTINRLASILKRTDANE